METLYYSIYPPNEPTLPPTNSKCGVRSGCTPVHETCTLVHDTLEVYAGTRGVHYWYTLRKKCTPVHTGGIKMASSGRRNMVAHHKRSMVARHTGMTALALLVVACVPTIAQGEYFFCTFYSYIFS